MLRMNASNGPDGNDAAAIPDRDDQRRNDEDFMVTCVAEAGLLKRRATLRESRTRGIHAWVRDPDTGQTLAVAIAMRAPGARLPEGRRLRVLGRGIVWFVAPERMVVDAEVDRRTIDPDTVVWMVREAISLSRRSWQALRVPPLTDPDEGDA